MPAMYKPFVSMGLAFTLTLQIWEDKLLITKVSGSVSWSAEIILMTWEAAGDIVIAMVISSGVSDIPNVRKQSRCTA